MIRSIVIGIAVSIIAISGTDASEVNIKPRTILAKPAHVHLAREHAKLPRLVIKLVDDSDIRVQNSEFVRKNNLVANLPTNAHIEKLNLASTIGGSLLREHSVHIERLFSRDEARLEDERRAGMRIGGEQLADLNLFFSVTFESSVSRQEAQLIADALLELDIVESAYFERQLTVNASDIAPTTPSFETYQNHLDQAFDNSTIDSFTGLKRNGIEARYAWTFPGGRGANVNFVDVDEGWDTIHEDLNSANQFILVQEYGSSQWHGTAVLGLINAQPNGFGMTGIASDAGYGLVNPFTGSGTGAENTADAINRAASHLSSGDVLLVEVGFTFYASDYQAAGCTYSHPGSPDSAVPVEDALGVFSAIRAATLRGIVVVETASNGSANLDDPCFSNRYNRATRDSGAILVGASVKGSLYRASFSSYGDRIDVQGQGNLVATTATAPLNDLFPIGLPAEINQQYTAQFNGTSSAGAIVAGAVLSLQGIQFARNGHKIPALPTPSAPGMRDILKAHGTDPAFFPGYLGSSYNGVGPMPNLRTTIDWMLADSDGDGMTNGDEVSIGRNPNIANWLVTIITGPNGTATTTALLVDQGNYATFGLTPDPGYVPIVSGGTCAPGSFIFTNLYQTVAIGGNCSVAIAFVTIPSAPAIFSAIPGSSEAYITTTSSSNGGSPITTYTVTCTPGSISVQGYASPIKITGLTNGTTYSCSATATNFAGTSNPSGSTMVTPSATAPLAVVGVQSRKVHGTLGPMDLSIDSTIALGGAVTVEPRQIGSGFNIVFQFNWPITSVGTVTSLDASLAAVGTPILSFAGNEVSVALTGVNNTQRTKISLTGVNGTAAATASLGFLIGDINSDRTVNVIDVGIVKGKAGKTPSLIDAVFLKDLNADGVINVLDVIAVTTKSGTNLLP